MAPDDRPPSIEVLGVPISAVDWDEALERVERWGESRESRYVCLCNVHSVVTATRDPSFLDVVAQADMATPDGAPIAWMMRRLGRPAQRRVSGPDLMWAHCERAARSGAPVFLLGSTEATLAALCERLRDAFPALRIAGTLSPPFRPLSDAEDADLVARVNDSGAHVVFVSLGCPKQERWMAEHRGRIRAVMLGVGAAFDFHSGLVTRAPAWMRQAGLEWLHRLASEPGRLWKRYVSTNSRFLLGAARQLLFHR